MRVATIFGTTLAFTVGIGGVAEKLANAIVLGDGTVYFAYPPDLVDATTTFKNVYVWGATYYFTISIPEKAGEPFQRVTITQRQGTDNIRYDLNDTRAFVGTRYRARRAIDTGRGNERSREKDS